MERHREVNLKRRKTLKQDVPELMAKFLKKMKPKKKKNCFKKYLEISSP